jgi:hypothetical protein
MLDRTLLDLRLALRGLWRARAFAAAALLTLAVGLSGTTIVFALVEGALLRPLPIREQDRLTVAWRELRSAGFSHYPFRIPPTVIDAIVDPSRTLERVADVGYNGADRFAVIENGTASYINSAFVTADFFAVLGVEPILGRAFTRADDGMGAEPALVITHGLWLRRYGGSRDVIGRKVTIGERPFAIVGVMPADLDYVRQRQTEIGVRVALGATAADVRRFVLAEGLRMALPGAASGIAAAAAATRLLRGLLFDVDPLDPAVLLGTAALIAAAATLAIYMPVRRAVRVDPVAMLRADRKRGSQPAPGQYGMTGPLSYRRSAVVLDKVV